MATRQTARAKINLALHVTGQRPDANHLLDSVVAFAGIGDLVTVAPAERLSLTVCGPFAADVPPGDDNLALRAARLLGGGRGARITLDKRLPVASGIGGGSADAAACLKVLMSHWDVPLPDTATQLALGADIPVCLFGETSRMRGIGETIEPVDMPTMPGVLVNPGLPVATGAVFRALVQKENPPLPAFPVTAMIADWLEWLGNCRNDLEAPAIRLEPAISEVLAAIRSTTGCHLARMSGSGATCFGLYSTIGAARAAAAILSSRHPDWWVAPTSIG